MNKSLEIRSDRVSCVCVCVCKRQRESEREREREGAAEHQAKECNLFLLLSHNSIQVGHYPMYKWSLLG